MEEQRHGMSALGAAPYMVRRRDFLRLAGATGASAALGPAVWPLVAGAATPSSPCTPGTLPFPGRPVGTPQPDLAPELANIEHIVILMMENHSFDNYLGMLPYRVPALAGRVDGFPSLAMDGIPTAAFGDGKGTFYRAFDLTSACQNGGPSQAWDASHISFNGGAMDGFVKGSGQVAMRYWDEDTLPFYYSLASQFPVCDRYFSSTLCQTYPNRVFAMAGTAGGTTSTDTPPPDIIPPNGRIFDVLEHYGISWADYYTNLPSPGLLGKAWAAQRAGTHFFGPFATFDGALQAMEAKILAGRLESVVMVEPDFQWGSEENPQNIQAGEYFIYKTISLLMKYPAVWQKTMIIFTYDEHGGYYDHVPPPAALNPGDGTHPNLPQNKWFGDDYTRLGFRVPTVIVSPWAKANFTSHTVYDHTSIMRTIEAKWNLPALTLRDANANDLRDCLVASGPAPFETPPTLTPAPISTPFGTAIADSTYCENVAKVNTTYPAAVRVPGPPQPPASYPLAKQACVPAVTPGLTSGGGGQSLPNTSTAAPGIGGILLGAAALGAAALVRRRTRPLPSAKAEES